jgi:hypothetical protein
MYCYECSQDGIPAGGCGNGYRLASLASANNPSGRAGAIKVKMPAGTTLGYILLYTNPSSGNGNSVTLM